MRGEKKQKSYSLKKVNLSIKPEVKQNNYAIKKPHIVEATAIKDSFPKQRKKDLKNCNNGNEKVLSLTLMGHARRKHSNLNAKYQPKG